MKFIPDSLGRKIGDSNLLASEKAPKYLFVGGVVGMVVSTGLACRATLKLSDTLDRAQHDLDVAKAIPQAEYDKNGDSRQRDIFLIKTKAIGSVAALYAPAVLVGGLSIAALTKSHNILQDRNIALTAALTAAEGAYSRYRQRVVDRYGEDVDRELYYESERVDIVDDETGEIVSTEVVTDAPGSRYARWYDEESAANWSPNHDVNIYFLRCCQSNLNDRLHARGHLFLNEVFDAIGMKPTKDGQVVGWLFNKGTGDDFVDFGIWNKEHEFDSFFGNGRDGAILLDFNVDGLILNRFEGDS